MKLIVSIVLALLIETPAFAQSVELMKICGEYATVSNMERDLKAARKNGGASADAEAMLKDLKAGFQKKKKQFEKDTGEKFSERTCREYELLD